jgi:hypothetical protein
MLDTSALDREEAFTRAVEIIANARNANTF